MIYIKKIALFLALFAGLAAYSFGDTLFAFPIGIYRVSEKFPDEKYGKEALAFGTNIAVNHYFGNFPLGMFFNTALVSISSGQEWKGEEMASTDSISSTDLRISLGPSFGLKLGRIVQIPISLGPLFSYCYEENYGYNTAGFYESVNIGVLGDIAVAINPFRRFLIKSGLTVSYDFARWERGRMDTELRQVFIGGGPKKVNFNALTIGGYVGIGVRIGAVNPKAKEKGKNNMEERVEEREEENTLL